METSGANEYRLLMPFLKNWTFILTHGRYFFFPMKSLELFNSSLFVMDKSLCC